MNFKVGKVNFKVGNLKPLRGHRKSEEVNVGRVIITIKMGKEGKELS